MYWEEGLPSGTEEDTESWGALGIEMYPPNLYTSEKAMAAHSSSLAWKILWTEELGGLQSMGSPRVGHD